MDKMHSDLHRKARNDILYIRKSKYASVAKKRYARIYYLRVSEVMCLRRIRSYQRRYRA